jgi:hypothetical protein
MRIEAMTKINKGSIVRSLANLVEKEMASVEYDSSGNSKLWSAVQCSRVVQVALVARNQQTQPHATGCVAPPL